MSEAIQVLVERYVQLVKKKQREQEDRSLLLRESKKFWNQVQGAMNSIAGDVNRMLNDNIFTFTGIGREKFAATRLIDGARLTGSFNPKKSTMMFTCPNPPIDCEFTFVLTGDKVTLSYLDPLGDRIQTCSPNQVAYDVLSDFIGT
jgi:hypothetical protein